MRKSGLQILLARLLGVAAVIWIVYDWVFVDEGLRYFTEDRSHILLLLAIVAIGTPFLLGYQALSVERKYRIALWVVGMLAAGATALAAYSLYMVIRLASFLYESGWVGMGLLGVLLPCSIAACLWWAFFRVRQRKPIW